MDVFVEKNKAKKPCDPGSNSGENSGPSVSTVKRAICQLPNLDLSPLRHPMESFHYYTEVNPLHGHSSTCPVPSSPNPNVFRSLTPGAEQPPFAHLTIFYAGKMSVYNVSANKANDIMAVASTISGSPCSGSPSSFACTPSTLLYSVPGPMDMTPIRPCPSAVAILNRTQSDHTIKSVALPAKREFSVMRILEKRNDRIHRKGSTLAVLKSNMVTGYHIANI